MNSVVFLKQLLDEMNRKRGPTFSGIGLIVWDGVTPLPVLPMREQPAGIPCAATSELLLHLADSSSVYHDGFHVLDASLNLVITSAYFSPPIPAAPGELRPHGRGGRYFAARFGSELAGVMFTAVLSNAYGPHIYQAGKEI